MATFIEGLITYLFGDYEGTKPYLRYIALALGVGLAIIYKVNIPAMLGLEAIAPVASFVLSGIVIGRGSNYLNDVLGLIKK